MTLAMNYKLLLDNQMGTSLVNFCEPDNYSSIFVEKFNVWSSLVISLFGILGIIKLFYSNELTDLLKKHTGISLKQEFSNRSFNFRLLLNIILFFIGIGSFLFHSKTSQFYHWIDIFFISLILILAEYQLDNMFRNKTVLFYYVVGLIHLITSLMIPSIHIFIQFGTGFMIVKKINYHMIKFKNNIINNYDIAQIYKKIEYKYNKTKIIFYLSLLCWVIDYFGCKFIKPLHTHWIFHIGIGWMSYLIIDLTKYLYLSKTLNENKV